MEFVKGFRDFEVYKLVMQLSNLFPAEFTD